MPMALEPPPTQATTQSGSVFHGSNWRFVSLTNNFLKVSHHGRVWVRPIAEPIK